MYLYGGKNRSKSLNSVTFKNKAVKEGKEYSVPKNMGLLIVTIPNQEIDTELDFEYWIDDAYVKLSASRLSMKLLNTSTICLLGLITLMLSIY